MDQQKTSAILLKQTLLANDDVALDFFTREYGRITIFVRKLARSKKKKSEIDFFRLLELVLTEGRTGNKSLKSIEAQKIFHGFSTDFSMSQVGFSFLETLRQIVPEEKPDSQFFDDIFHIFLEFKPENALLLQVFFAIKVAAFSGTFPHFDEFEGDVYLDLETHALTQKEINSVHSIFIPNIERRILEFFHQNDLRTVQAIQKKIPEKNLNSVFLLLEKMNN